MGVAVIGDMAVSPVMRSSCQGQHAKPTVNPASINPRSRILRASV
jgi:hypothetical protein